MAPSRNRAHPDDQRSETSSIKENAAASSAVNGKARRTANQAGGSSLRDVTTLGQDDTGDTGHGSNGACAPGIRWLSFDNEILEGYRYAYQLNAPAAFKSSYNQAVLTHSGIGRHSPTMARRKDQRKQSKEQLANAVRRHFNGMGVVENEVIVDFLYKIRWQDKAFRMQFMPPRPSMK